MTKLQAIQNYKVYFILRYYAQYVQFSVLWCVVAQRYNSNSADLQMRHQKLCTLARHFSVGHFA